MCTTIHFEGIPGSGKTTASERLCSLLGNNGIDTTWWQEGASNHPAMLHKKQRVLSGGRNFPGACLNAWQTFLKSSSSTVILDGYAFQSTVRFLYANLVERTQIEDYFRRWQELAPDTTLVYFSVENPVEHFDMVLAERGAEWSNKLFAYVERTPIGVANDLQGRAGFVQFWSDYQQLCHELLGAALVSVHFIHSRSWKDDDLKELAAQAGLLPERL